MRRTCTAWAMPPREQTETLFRWMYRSVADAPQILGRRFGDAEEEEKNYMTNNVESRR